MEKFLISVAFFLSGPGICFAAQQTPASPNSSASISTKQGSPSQRDANLTMEGEIIRVDDKQNIFWLQMPDGREMQFSFAKDTPITGSATATQGTPTQGLRTTPEKGMHVKVQYDNVGGSNVVTKIEIQAAKG